MARFIDRESEMKTLENEYTRSGSSLVILYGRRRVGKTSLISEFIKDKNALFFLASEEPEVQNRNAFKEKAADFIQSDLLRDAAVSSWDAIFKAIINTPFDQKPIIVIDEFQYIGKSNPAFPSIFQRIWEEQLNVLGNAAGDSIHFDQMVFIGTGEELAVIFEWDLLQSDLRGSSAVKRTVIV